jgi:hypothetical protein
MLLPPGSLLSVLGPSSVTSSLAWGALANWRCKEGAPQDLVFPVPGVTCEGPGLGGCPQAMCTGLGRLQRCLGPGHS